MPLSFDDMLKDHLNTHYRLFVARISLIREMIATAYLIETRDQRYVLKVYDPMHAHLCEISAMVMDHLEPTGLSPKVIRSAHGTLTEDIHVANMHHKMVLMTYVDGSDVDALPLSMSIKCQIEHLHQHLQGLKDHLPIHGIDFFVNRFIRLLEDKRVDEVTRAQMKTIGDNLFDYVLKLKNGVCHGDFHTGNMKMVNHQLVVFDYDAVAISSPLIDYATVFDTSDFNHFEYEAFLSTTAVFSDIAKTRTELLGMLAFVPIRHFELIATIGNRHGLERLSMAFLNEQIKWITDWVSYLNQTAS